MPEQIGFLKMVFVGDVFPMGRATLGATSPILKGADITFGQLESVISKRGTYQVFQHPPELNRRPGAQVPANSQIQRNPETQLNNIVDAGFNLISFASNHTYQYSEDGVIDTVEALKSKNIACIGAGKDIIEATKPAIFEKKGQRIGFLAYCSVVPPGGWATYNKAGVAPIRASTSYEQIDWQPGSPPRTFSWCNQDDVAGMEEDIKKLKSQVDVVVVSMHWGVHHVPGLIADYQYEAGHAAVDAGADLIIGHHAHILKGIEVYKGKVIFYSLGNFYCPPGRKISPIHSSGLYWTTKFGMRLQVDIEHPYFPDQIDSQKTILVKCDIADKKIQRVSYLPLWMNAQNVPEILSYGDSRNEKHLEYMRWLCGSQELDTNFVSEGNEVAVVL